MRSAWFIVAALLLQAAGFPAEIYVPDDHLSIQAAIDAAADGDIDIVRPGVYSENIDFTGKAIHLRSKRGPYFTHIDGNSAGTVVSFLNQEDGSSVLEGFTITNGDGSYGGGIFCENGSSPLIRNNIISSNNGGLGGGISCFESSPVIEHNIILENSAGSGGGIGIVLKSSPIIRRNIINENWSYIGGGIYCYCDSSPMIEGNLIKSNYVDNGGDAFGGGIYCKDSSSTITNNMIANNSTFSWTAGDANGGGIYSCDSSLMILNNSIIDNKTYMHGCGGSAGGGICCDGGNLTVVNTILWDNDDGQIDHLGGSLTVEYSNVGGLGGGWPGTGNISEYPRFVDRGSDYHLTWDSPCRDRGDNSAVTGSLDFEDDPRIQDGTVDMGADEFHEHLYHTGEVRPGALIHFMVIGSPAAPVILGHGSGIQDPPQATPYGNLFLDWPIHHAGIGVINSDGYLDYPWTVFPFWQSGLDHPLQALVGLHSDPSRLLTNLMVLTVE